MRSLEDAISLAVQSHRGQTDKAGRQYISHPLCVMLSFKGGAEDDDARMAAILHDVVEDTPVALSDLAHAGYPHVVVQAVDVLTRRADAGESYPAYISRVATNPLAVRVKLADLEDNLDPNRTSTGMLAGATIKKYKDARAFLRQCMYIDNGR
jgi:(p)ppGpp synthase/HD superfamily hydrolase